MSKIKTTAELEAFRKEILDQRDPDKPCITLCSGSACNATGSGKVAAALELEIEKQGVTTEVVSRRTGCHGFCEQGPIVVIYPQGICYLKVQPDDIAEIISETIIGKKIVERLLYVDPNTGEKTTLEEDIPFYKNQQRLVLGSNRKIDPRSLEDYLAVDGYQALSKVLFEMTPEQVVGEVKDAKLRGRGGAGFPSGLKWDFARKAPGDQKYVVVNCDEGDPGAYMDRSVMEGNPFAVLEGLMIGAYAIGANEGYIYVRQEYPLAVANLSVAIEKAEEYGLLGKDILGSGFDFTIKVHRGAGAFICGEETSLLNSLEGKAGEPNARPPFPAIRGLWGKPTNINNVETWANIPMIINKGAAFFSAIGTEGSKGTKIFSLVGKVNNTGLVEVPMGASMRDIIFKIGGGVPGGKTFKAVQTGGPSGGCLPESLLDIKVDFDELTQAGAMMGSGGMIVMDEDTCLVDIARYFLAFLSDESCGKCTPCREGIRQMLKILTNMTKGLAKEGDIELLFELAEATKGSSMCALGKTAPNPVLSTLNHFREEYEAHINEKRCPSLSCKALIDFYIDPEKCKGCGACFRKCPAEAIEGGKKRIHVVDQDKCTRCGGCLEACPAAFGAVSKVSGVPIPDAIPEEARAIG
ncbi:MAG TPA: NADH-quinone oxidoreductase subunit NuoF [Malonomonas sp.]